MTYVFDTSAFIVLKNYYLGAFATLWSRIDSMADAGSIISVREVFNELAAYNDADFIQEWAKVHKPIFHAPSNAETLAVQRIFAVQHFQSLISAKALLKGTPVADPFVVAAGLIQGAVVVTQEQLKPNAAKIPNVCERFNVRCLDLQGFMAAEGWAF